MLERLAGFSTDALTLIKCLIEIKTFILKKMLKKKRSNIVESTKCYTTLLKHLAPALDHDHGKNLCL